MLAASRPTLEAIKQGGSSAKERSVKNCAARLLTAALLCVLGLAMTVVPLEAQGSTAEAETIEIPYIPYEGSARRVIVNVTFNGRVTVPMALDTGAPRTHISYAVAEKLGALRSSEGTLAVNSSGIGGSAPAIRTVLESASIGGATVKVVPVTVISKLSNAFDGLLGMDLLADYEITIRSVPPVVVLTRKSSGGDRPGGHGERWWRETFREFRSYKSEWERYRDAVDREIESGNTVGQRTAALRRYRELADSQIIEADKLLSRLESYASRHAVPRHWRR